MIKNCGHCESEFTARPQQRFCSSSCGALSRHAAAAVILQCEFCQEDFRVPPSRGDVARFCSYECDQGQAELDRKGKTLASVQHGDGRSKWAVVRKDARKTLKKLEREEACEHCGFDVVVECCHVRAITDFDLTATLAEVNAEDNLVYLCPNHHAMFDRGMLKLETA